MSQDKASKPLKMRSKLLEKISYHETDIMSFRFSRTDEQNNNKNNNNNYLNYKDGHMP
jgi:hypothetical protein